MMLGLHRKLILFGILLCLSTAYSKKRYYKFFKAEIKAYEPYANVTFFRLKPINRNLAVVNAEVNLKRDFKNGMVSTF